MNIHIPNEIFQWYILPAIIFIARVCDMSLDTIRILMISRGHRVIAPVLGFIQVMIWLVVIRQIFLNLSNFIYYVAYAGGFAVGTYIGMILEERLAVGFQVVRVITQKGAAELINNLKKHGFGVTSLDARGAEGDVSIIFTIVRRCAIQEVICIVRKFNPRAFYTIEDIRSVSEGFQANRYSPREKTLREIMRV